MSIAIERATQNREEIVWGAAVFDQVWTAWEELRKATHEVASLQQSRMTAYFPGGGKIIFRSLDNPHNARSKTADGIVIDEAGFVPQAAYYEVLRPMLIDTRGWLLVAGTPKGRNWFWREITGARDDPKDSLVFHAPTYGCEIVNERLVRKPHPNENPDITFEEVVAMYRSMPERMFRQEILAEFLDETGGVFRKVEAAIDSGRTKNAAYNRRHRYTMGVDLARVNDFTVLTVVNELGEQVAFERFNQVSWERQKASIIKMARDYRASVLVDSTGLGDPIYEDLRRAGLRVKGYHFTSQSKEALIDNLAMKLEEEQLRLMDIESQRDELLAYQYELTAARNVRMNAPQGMFDDCVIALALAVWNTTRARVGRPILTVKRKNLEGFRVA